MQDLHMDIDDQTNSYSVILKYQNISVATVRLYVNRKIKKGILLVNYYCRPVYRASTEIY
jgi:hypothetical protein